MQRSINFYHPLNDLNAKTRWSNLFKLIDSFGHMVCLTVSKLHEFLLYTVRNMSNNKRTPSLIYDLVEKW